MNVKDYKLQTSYEYDNFVKDDNSTVIPLHHIGKIHHISYAMYKLEQDGAELGQAQVKLKLQLKLEIGVDNSFQVIFKLFLRVGGCGK